MISVNGNWELFNSRLVPNSIGPSYPDTIFTEGQIKLLLSDEDNISVYPFIFEREISPSNIIQTVIYNYQLDNTKTCLIMVNRQNHEQIIGYNIVQRNKWDLWQADTPQIFLPYQNLGFATDFIISAVKSGFRVISKPLSVVNPIVSTILEAPTTSSFINAHRINLKSAELIKDSALSIVSTDPWVYLARRKKGDNFQNAIANLNSDVFLNIAFKRYLIGKDTWTFNVSDHTNYLNYVLSQYKTDFDDVHHHTITAATDTHNHVMTTTTESTISHTHGAAPTYIPASSSHTHTVTSADDTHTHTMSETDHTLSTHSHNTLTDLLVSAIIYDTNSTKWFRQESLQKHNLDWTHFLNWVFTSITVTNFGTIGQP
jgi:hypothetical protein